MLKVGIVGDYNESSETHRATDLCFEIAARRLGAEVQFQWLPTSEIVVRELPDFDALLIGTGVYENRSNALEAIKFARANLIPTLATCGGFQHMILEFARNVLGVVSAGHAEFDADGERVIVPLPCSLRGREMIVAIQPNTVVGKLYAATTARERYYCSFGIAPSYVEPLRQAGLTIAGSDDEGLVRVTELADHPFYVGTLFVPQAHALANESHPLIEGLLRAGS